MDETKEQGRRRMKSASRYQTEYSRKLFTFPFTQNAYDTTMAMREKVAESWSLSCFILLMFSVCVCSGCCVSHFFSALIVVGWDPIISFFRSINIVIIIVVFVFARYSLFIIIISLFFCNLFRVLCWIFFCFAEKFVFILWF